MSYKKINKVIYILEIYRIVMKLMIYSQEREVRIEEEERTRTKLKRESWYSKKMDKVRV